MNLLIKLKDLKRYIIFLLSLMIVFSSCVTQREIEYVQKKGKKTEIAPVEYTEYLLQPNDELYIKITSLDDASANAFLGSTMQSYNLDAYSTSLISYTIDKDGYVDLPVIGKIAAKDKTVSQVGTSIKQALVNILNQPIVSVKLVNKYVSVLGEVIRPGHVVFVQDKISVFSAIGLAGDITDYGNREKVLLIRNQNGKNERIELDLTKTDILSSEYYYLRPNDILYVKPMRNKFWGLRQFPFSTVLAAITTTILVWDFANRNN